MCNLTIQNFPLEYQVTSQLMLQTEAPQPQPTEWNYAIWKSSFNDSISNHTYSQTNHDVSILQLIKNSANISTWQRQLKFWNEIENVFVLLKSRPVIYDAKMTFTKKGLKAIWNE